MGSVVPRGKRARTSDRRVVPVIESLEGKMLLSAPGVHGPAHARPAVHAQAAPAANPGLVSIYHVYQQRPGQSAALAARFPSAVFRGSTVRIEVTCRGNFNALYNEVRGLGMRVTSASANPALVEGYAPISQLPAIAHLPQTASVQPLSGSTLEPLWLPA